MVLIVPLLTTGWWGEQSGGGPHSHHSVPCLVISMSLTQSSLTAFISTLQHVPGRSADTTDFCGCRSHPPVEKIAISAPPIGEYIGRQMRIIRQRQKMLDAIDIYPILYANSIAATRLSYIGSVQTFYGRFSEPALLSRTSGTDNQPTTNSY